MIETGTSGVRARIFRSLVLILFAILTGNLFGMMVLRHGKYEDKALENRQLRFRVKAPRGRITDRDSALLADNMYIADITLPADALVDGYPDSTLYRLINWFDLPPEETLTRLAAQKKSGKRELILVANATMPQIITIE